MAVNVTVYPGRVKLEEVSRHAHREQLLVADPHDRDGHALAEAVADWCNGADAVYLSRVGDAGALHRTVEARLQALDGAELRTEGQAADHVVGDVPIRGAKVVRPADEAAVVMGEPPEGYRQPGEPPEAARPLEPKPLPSLADSAGTTHAHHVGGKRLRTGDEPTAEPETTDAPAGPQPETTGGQVTEDEAAADPRTKDDLRAELERAGLPVSGSKREQLQRLRDAGA